MTLRVEVDVEVGGGGTGIGKGEDRSLTDDDDNNSLSTVETKTDIQHAVQCSRNAFAVTLDPLSNQETPSDPAHINDGDDAKELPRLRL